MRRGLRGFLLTLLAIILLVVGFYFYGSRGWYKGEQNEVIIYGEHMAPKDTLKVMTYNIGYLSGMKNNLATDTPEELFVDNLDKLKAFLKQEDPDIIGLQEVDFQSSRSYFQNQLDSVANELGYYTSYRSITWDKRYVPFPYWPPKHHFGKVLSGHAILSKYPIENESTLILEKPISAAFYFKKFYLERPIQKLSIRVGDRLLNLMHLHFEAFDQKTRENQAKVLKELCENSEELPTLILGDFNAEPSWTDGEDQTMNTVFSTLGIASAIDSAKYLSNPNAHFSFSSREPYQMIDYVLYNPSELVPLSSKVHQEAGEISDHFPVSLTFTFSPEKEAEVND